MSRNRNGTLKYQVTQKLQSKLAIGRSKALDKLDGSIHDKIYSWKTYNTYLERSLAFCDWCKTVYGCRTLEECWQYRNDYIQTLIDSNKSPFTIKLEVSALSKLYDCTSKDFIDTPARHREDITRSRGKSSGEKRFSEANHQELVDFCRSTGLRRGELEHLRGSDLRFKDGQAYIHVHTNTKGGRERYAPIIGTDEQIQAVVDRMQSAGDGIVWEYVPKAMDVHSYRSDYCTAYYKMVARDAKTLPKSERYCCKHDKRGIWYDRKAMLLVSEALGHSRIDVIAENYLR